MAKKKSGKKDKDKPKEVEGQAPVLCRTGTLLLLSAFRITELTGDDFRQQLGKALDDIADEVRDPEAIKRFRKKMEL